VPAYSGPARALRAARRPQPTWPARDAQTIPDEQAQTAEQELLTAEHHAALRDTLAHLATCCRQLLAILTADPPGTVRRDHARLGIPVGCIAPSRGRCLDKLRRHPAIAALIYAEAQAQAA
jgi:hypothetical protein